jgi:hypothetical protein
VSCVTVTKMEINLCAAEHRENSASSAPPRLILAGIE